jgi:hypothetical protein
MTQYLYLKILRCATSLLLVTCALPMLGQYAASRRSEPRNTTRAVAVLEVDAKGTGRLYPVMLMLEGKIYDASLYGSRPVPMALWGETVYEVQKGGMPQGLITLTLARRLGTQWWGEGMYKSFAADDKKNAKTKKSGKPEDKKADAKPATKSDDDRPVLKRPKPDTEPAGTSEPAKTTTGQATTPEQKPTDTKADAKTDAKPEAKTDTTASQNAPGAETPKEPPKSSRKGSGPDDPDRPVLRRGMPVGTSQVKEQPYETLTPIKAKELNTGRGPVQTFVAVSDAAPGDNRPFDMQLGPEEQEKYGREAAKQAWGELKRHAGANVLMPAEPAFTNVSIRSFDLDYSNNPVLVYTAQFKPGPAPVKKTAKKRGEPEENPMPPPLPVTYYVTWVGKVDAQGMMNKMFASATDSAHLDVTSRMELIDAVDADADNRADLLFRQVSDVGSDYIIYRGSPYWAKLFEGAASR